eukprot:TRINITY_DN18864_c0_g1_i1.p1 TRINITY_DN18864_c0_g1~~TRINITY_DN18864_c0_g1_i1.p1  ORF type:complete len:613 (-),score=169.91 TRINITY_DN18864_c0_g1_i1:133-1971(-)
MVMGDGLGPLRPGTNMGGMGAPMGGPMTRPPTSGGGHPPGTASRQNLGSRWGAGPTRGGLGTRGGTAAGQPVIGVGLHSDVQIADRPITNHGMGLKTGSQGPKRQIHDRTYFLVELKRRCQDLSDEIMKLHKELEQTREDNQLYLSLEKRYDSLVKTVRSLEGDLADYNLATDKARTETGPEDVHQMFLLMKQQNDQQRNDVDQIFLEKRSHEEVVAQVNEEIQAISRVAEERLSELHPDQRRMYQMLKAESLEQSGDLAEAREEFEQLSSRLMISEASLHRDVLRSHAQQLLEARKEAMQRLEQLQLEAQQGSMSVPEQREILLAKVKQDNSEIVATEKLISELRFEKEGLKRQIQEVDADSQEKKDDSDRQKYDILFSKDQEMTQFIDSFDESFKEEEKKRQEKQDRICRLLENISTAVALESGVTPESHMRDMEDELQFKNQQLINSESTQNRLEAELVKRQGELEKIDSLDAKISSELQQVETQQAKYEEEIVTKFDRIEEMRAECQAKLAELVSRKANLEVRAAALKQQGSFLKIKYDTRKQQMQDDEVYTKLESQEQKIQSFGQTLQALSSFIQQKNSESDFKHELSFVLQGAEKLNKMLLTGRVV